MWWDESKETRKSIDKQTSAPTVPEICLLARSLACIILTTTNVAVVSAYVNATAAYLVLIRRWPFCKKYTTLLLMVLRGSAIVASKRVVQPCAETVMKLVMVSNFTV